MPKFFWLTIAVFAHGFLSAQTLSLSWSSPVTVAGGSAYGSQRPRIALVQDSIPLVSWGKNNAQLFASRWNGSAFTAPATLTPAGVNCYVSTAEGPELAAKGDTAYAVMFTTDDRLYAFRSSDGGLSWSDTLRIDQQDSLLPYTPVVAVGPGGNPYIAYEASDANFNFPKHYFIRSTDGGNTFLPEVIASDASVGQPCECCPPAIALRDTNVFIAYRNNLNNLRECYVSSSANNGASFFPAAQFDFSAWNITACPTSGPDLHLNGDSLTAVWMSRQGTLTRIFAGTWNTATQQFGFNRLADPNPPASFPASRPSVAGSGDTLGVTWDDNRNGNPDCWLSVSVDGAPGLNTVLQVNDTASDAGTQNNVNVAYGGGYFHFVYTDVMTNSIIYRKARIEGFVGENEFTQPGGALKIFPNPAQEIFSVEAKSAGTFELFDLSGACVRREKISAGRRTVRTDELASGVYLYRFSGEKNYVVHGKIVLY